MGIRMGGFLLEEDCCLEAWMVEVVGVVEASSLEGGSAWMG
jgi:hypothetical protein